MKRYIIILVLVILLIPIHVGDNSKKPLDHSKLIDINQASINSISSTSTHANDQNSELTQLSNINHEYDEPISPSEIGTDGVIESSPGNISIAINSNPFDLTWDVTGPNGQKKYDIYLNNTLITSGSYQSVGTITYLFNPSVEGIFNVTLFITSNAGQDTDTIWITVEKFLTFTQTPGNLTFSLGSGPNPVEWRMDADIPGNYSIFKNDTVFITSSWAVNQPVIAYAPDELGNHNLTILVYDDAGNNITDSSYITITAGPVLIDKTPNNVYDNETSLIEYFWIFEANDPANYSIYQDQNTLLDSGEWVSGIPITLDLIDLDLGLYNYGVFVNETDSEFLWSNVTIIVDDRPEFEEVPSSALNMNEEGLTEITWIGEDLTADQYEIAVNNTILVSNSWTTLNPIEYNFTGFAKGVYNISINLYDIYGLSRSHSLLMTVEDTTSPDILSSPSNLVFSYTESTIIINIDVIDSHPDLYEVRTNDFITDVGLWSTGLTFEFVDRAIGSYVINVTFYDESENFVSSIINLQIVDPIMPQLVSNPQNSTYMVYETAELNWIFIDVNPFTYNITSNISNNILSQGSWSSNNNISLSITFETVGIILYTISTYDVSGNKNNNSILFEIIPVETIEPDLRDNDRVYADDPINIENSWLKANELGVSEGMIDYNLYNSSNLLLFSGINQTTTSGEFTLHLPHNNLKEGEYNWLINFSKFQHQNWSIQIQVFVEWHQISLSLTVPNEIEQGESFDVQLTVEYTDNVQSQLSPFILSPLSGGVGGITFDIIVNLRYMDDSENEVKLQGETNENGLSSIFIGAENTEDLASLESIVIEIDSSLNLNIASSSIFTGFNTEIIPDGFTNWFELEFGFQPAIVIITIILIFINPIINKIKILASKVEKLSSRRKYRFYYEMSSIRTILIFNNHGILFYVNQFGQSSSLDPSLIAGLSSAITSFLGEIDNVGRGTYGFHKMEKQDLSITIHSGVYSSVAILSSIDITEEVKTNFSQIHKELEKEFVREFERGIGNFGSDDEKKIQQIFTKWDVHVPLMSSVTFDRAEVIRIQQEGKLPTLLKIELANVLNKSGGDLDGRTFTYNELVKEFGKYEVSPELSGKIIYELYLREAFI